MPLPASEWSWNDVTCDEDCEAWRSGPEGQTICRREQCVSSEHDAVDDDCHTFREPPPGGHRRGVVGLEEDHKNPLIPADLAAMANRRAHGTTLASSVAPQKAKRQRAEAKEAPDSERGCHGLSTSLLSVSLHETSQARLGLRPKPWSRGCAAYVAS